MSRSSATLRRRSAQANKQFHTLNPLSRRPSEMLKPHTRNSRTSHWLSEQFGRARVGDCLISSGGWEGQSRAQSLEKMLLNCANPIVMCVCVACNMVGQQMDGGGGGAPRLPVRVRRLFRVRGPRQAQRPPQRPVAVRLLHGLVDAAGCVRRPAMRALAPLHDGGKRQVGESHPPHPCDPVWTHRTCILPVSEVALVEQ